MFQDSDGIDDEAWFHLPSSKHPPPVHRQPVTRIYPPSWLYDRSSHGSIPSSWGTTTFHSQDRTIEREGSKRSKHSPRSDDSLQRAPPEFRKEGKDGKKCCYSMSTLKCALLWIILALLVATLAVLLWAFVFKGN